MKTYFVYILGNDRPTLYVGVTNNLERRVYEHQQELIPGFSKKYHLHKLLYFEQTESIESAIKREKQLKSWNRQWKLELISKNNPMFDDLTQTILGSSPRMTYGVTV